MKTRKAIRFLKFLKQDEKFLKKKFIKKEAAGGGSSRGGVARGASTGSASASDLGKIPASVFGVVSEPGVSYELDAPAIPKRKKKNRRE